MQPGYSIVAENSARRIRYQVSGFWDAKTIEAFRADLLANIRSFANKGVKPTLLCDATRFSVQSSVVVTMFEAMMAADVMPKIDRLAITFATALNKLQAERGAMSVAHVRAFLNEADALAWLDTTV